MCHKLLDLDAEAKPKTRQIENIEEFKEQAPTEFKSKNRILIVDDSSYNLFVMKEIMAII